VASALFLAASVSVYAWPRWWWALGGAGVVASMAAIVPSWADAKFGALANLIVLAGVVCGVLAQGPGSLRAKYDADVARATAPAATSIVTEADLAPLPAPVQRYLRLTGAVGRPRVRDFRVRMHGRIRSGPGAGWMTLTAEQHNLVGDRTRFFYLNATMFGVPVQGYHRYADRAATMRIKAAALVPVVDAAGDVLTRSETVTLFNDLCVMAPATLVDPAILWEPVDAHTARASFSNAGHTIGAELRFNDTGELVDFVSDDRYQVPAEGPPVRLRWSTPLRDYRAFGDVRLASRGEGRWHEPGGSYAYIDLTIDDVRYNTGR
jgi:hypothetical protein